MIYDDDAYYSKNLYPAEFDKRMDEFLYRFRIKIAGRKLMQEYDPLTNYIPIKNTLGDAIDSIKTKTVEYQQFEMPALRFNDLVEVFSMNRAELACLRAKFDKSNKEQQLREKFPSLQKAYEQYQLVLSMVENQK